ncbi:hypothetical protein RFI_10435 [Reticulomyxa filosa]|uniref:Glycosyl transferase family 1 domain-containing protein n=1 Tax=Reticulomyxa filosa TaxID=46433 RepID=X6NLT7_RETFI|nr:hypothetical protein RFI_10435 [Reticulomyxa filosa]|eukprot:ETO26699.1 hypothetical protein RFI_10435 [Reticulomyxa filosa]
MTQASLEIQDSEEKVQSMRESQRRYLFVAYEFIQSTVFSGNGVYGRTIVSSLLQKDCDVVVVCAHPQIVKNDEKNTNKMQFLKEQMTVQDADKKKTMNDNRHNCWHTGACKQMENVGSTERLSKTSCFSHLLFVDYSACLASQVLVTILNLFTIKKTYFNFRVFHKNSNLTKSSKKNNEPVTVDVNDDDDVSFYVSVEKQCVDWSDQIIALCQMDLQALQQLSDSKLSSDSGGPHEKMWHVLYPPLQPAVHALALKTKPILNEQKFEGNRKYILCCVRISPEKNMMVFIDMLPYLQMERFADKNVSLFIVGSCNDVRYKQTLVSKLEHYSKQYHIPYVMHEFLQVDEFSVILRSSIVNVHTSLNEPYGMTIMESAAFQTPSIVHFQNIGAEEMMKKRTSSPSVFYSDLRDPKQLSIDVMKVLDMYFQNDSTYHKVSLNAQNIALGYGTDTFANVQWQQQMKALGLGFLKFSFYFFSSFFILHFYQDTAAFVELAFTSINKNYNDLSRGQKKFLLAILNKIKKKTLF